MIIHLNNICSMIFVDLGGRARRGRGAAPGQGAEPTIFAPHASPPSLLPLLPFRYPFTPVSFHTSNSLHSAQTCAPPLRHSSRSSRSQHLALPQLNSKLKLPQIRQDSAGVASQGVGSAQLGPQGPGAQQSHEFRVY